ncbi:MAG TPA: hydrogenase expression protein HypE [Xanthobacteraceae bacterium]|jgi:Ni,Fe-hydrogenase III large subunit/Ni,Fe-hydrogenase III component G|nr:hydrogenase expression protein HypE [Xanthobacteraceae bacterium]
MAMLLDIISQGERAQSHRPWPRFNVTANIWRQAANEIAAGHATLLGLWADRAALPMMHMAIMDEAVGGIAVASLACPDGSYPSIGALHPPAIRLERAIHSLYGYVALGLPDSRPWLDLGFWNVQHPLGVREKALAVRETYQFLPVEGESLHQIPVGPVHAGIIEPGHFRFTAGGETVVRLEERLGYVHKGIESLMTGASIARAAKLAARTSGDSTVAYGIAFAHAVEAALSIAAPPRSQFLRALLAELERLANHLGDIGAICNDASFSLMHAHCGILREQVLRAADDAFGHRLMMDRVIPGGVAADLNPTGMTRIREMLQQIGQRFPRLIELYDNTASLQDRTAATGILRAELARQFGASGYVGRASGRPVDARKMPGYPPYDRLSFTVPVLTAGDVNARVWIRIREVEQSMALVEQILDQLPDGPIATALDGGSAVGEGLGLAEGFRGDILAWVSLDGGQVARCHLRDPSWFQWPLLEAAIEGNIVADFPLCNKSFNCSYSGHDL